MCVRMARRWPAVGMRSRILEVSGTAPGRAKGLEENGVGPSGGGEGSVVFSNVEVRAKRMANSYLHCFIVPLTC